MTELMLIRHGETESNARGVVQGQFDAHLSARGQEQARRLGQRLAAEPPEFLYSSDLSRALDTARAVAAACGGLPIATDPRLREVDVGTWSNLTFREIQRRYPNQWAELERDDGRFRRGGGECGYDVQGRIVAALGEIVARHAGRRIAVVSHGFALRTYLAHLLGLPLGNLHLRFRLDNATISRVQLPLNGGLGTLLVLNDGCHLHELIAS